MKSGREDLVGRWFLKEEDNNGDTYMEVASLDDQGNFEFCFSTYAINGTVLEEVLERGIWGLVGDVHFTITLEEVINGVSYAAERNNADNYHAYKVLQLDENVFRYQHLLTGECYTLTRIKSQE